MPAHSFDHAESAADDDLFTRVPVHWLALSVALLVTAGVYVQAVFFEFAYDDFSQIVWLAGC
jgi:hypothetical protein